MRHTNNKKTAVSAALIVALAGAAATTSSDAFAFGKKKPATATTTAGQTGPTFSFSQITDYYRSRTQGLITPKPDEAHKASGLRFLFEATKKWGKRIMPPRLDREEIYKAQNAFQIDVEQFNQKQEGRDFLEASYNYYSLLRFDDEFQLHERPYSYLYSWGTLFHPPIKNLTLAREKYASWATPQDLDSRQSTYFDPNFQKRIDVLTDTALTYGNELKLLPNRTAFVEKLRLIREAKHSLYTASLVYVCDHTTLQLVQAMADAVKRGVDVRVIMEAITDPLDFGCTGKMAKAGVKVLTFSDYFRKRGGGVMHNKIWIRDTEEAILGGQNILEAENDSDGFNFRNRDTDILIKKGPAVTDVVLRYADLWDSRRTQNLPTMTDVTAMMEFRRSQELQQKKRGRANYEEWLSNPATRMNGVCRVAVQSSGADVQPLAAILQSHMEQSRPSIRFNSPTLDYTQAPPTDELRNWNDMMRDVLRRKSREGLKINVISNGFDGGNGELTIMLRELMEQFDASGHRLLAKIFQKLVYWTSIGSAKSNRGNMREMARLNGVNTYMYFNYNHAKTYIFDRLAVAVGSWNFDLYSGDKSNESMIVCMDKSLLQEAEDLYLTDLINSIPVTSLDGN